MGMHKFSNQLKIILFFIALFYHLLLSFTDEYSLNIYPSSYQDEAEKFYKQAAHFFSSWEIKKADSLFQIAYRKATDETIKVKSLYMIARCAKENYSYKEASKYYWRVVQEFPNSYLADDAYFQVCYLEEDVDSSIALYEKFLKRYPKSEHALGAMYRLGSNLYIYAKGNYKRGRQILQELIRQYPNEYLAKEARYDVLMSYFYEDNLDSVIAFFQENISHYPEGMWRGIGKILTNLYEYHRWQECMKVFHIVQKQVENDKNNYELPDIIKKIALELPNAEEKINFWVILAEKPIYIKLPSDYFNSSSNKSQKKQYQKVLSLNLLNQRLAALETLADLYISYGYTDYAIETLQYALVHSKNIEDTEVFLKLTLKLGYIFLFIKDKPDSALQYFKYWRIMAPKEKTIWPPPEYKLKKILAWNPEVNFYAYQNFKGYLACLMKLNNFRHLLKKHIPLQPQKSWPDSFQYPIKDGETLYSISRKFFGLAPFWRQIYFNNQSEFQDPNFIQSGQKLKLPAFPEFMLKDKVFLKFLEADAAVIQRDFPKASSLYGKALDMAKKQWNYLPEHLSNLKQRCSSLKKGLKKRDPESFYQFAKIVNRLAITDYARYYALGIALNFAKDSTTVANLSYSLGMLMLQKGLPWTSIFKRCLVSNAAGSLGDDVMYYLVKMEYLSPGQHNKAAIALEKIYNRYGSSADFGPKALYNAGLQYEYAGKPNEAMRCYRKLIIDNKIPPTYHIYALYNAAMIERYVFHNKKNYRDYLQKIVDLYSNLSRKKIRELSPKATLLYIRALKLLKD